MITTLPAATRTRLSGLSFYGAARVAVAVNEMPADERRSAVEWLSSYAAGTWQAEALACV